jgi:hypothetical protein
MFMQQSLSGSTVRYPHIGHFAALLHRDRRVAELTATVPNPVPSLCEVKTAKIAFRLSICP